MARRRPKKLSLGKSCRTERERIRERKKSYFIFTTRNSQRSSVTSVFRQQQSPGYQSLLHVDNPFLVLAAATTYISDYIAFRQDHLSSC